MNGTYTFYNNNNNNQALKGSCFTTLSDHECGRSQWLMNYNFTSGGNQLNNLDQIWYFLKGHFRWENRRLLLDEKPTLL